MSMPDLYWDQFASFATKDRHLKNWKFKLNMEEIQSKRLRLMPLDVTSDQPLPDWAHQILSASHLSKRTKHLLLQYHNKKIRQYRLHLSQGEQTNETEETGAYDPDEDSEEAS